MALHGMSHLLHHSVYTCPTTDPGPSGCARFIHSIWLGCFPVWCQRWPLCDHARPHPFARWFRDRIGICVGLDEVPQKRDFENLENRDFYHAALAKRFLRSRDSLRRIVRAKVDLCSKQSCARWAGSIGRRLALQRSTNRIALLRSCAVIDRDCRGAL